MYRIGCHTYIFHEYGYDPNQQLDVIFDIVARAGYEAIELNAPTFEIENWFERITAALNRTGLGLVGGSNGAALAEINRRDEILSLMDIYTDKLAQFGPVYCGFTCGGKHLKDRTPEENDQVVRMWIELAERCRRKGVVLNYHTHGEPIEDIRHVVDKVSADLLPLGPDLDWLRFGGVDPEGFLREHASRLVALHIRDYHLGGDRTESLGEGDADYACLGEVLEEIGFAGEFVVELALPPGKPPTRSVEENLTISRQHLRDTLGF